MIRSMTGFGRGEYTANDRKITIEIKSVNHRYLDATIKLPRKLNAYDSILRNRLKAKIERGKVDIFVTYEDLSGKDDCIQYNHELADQYVMYYRKIAEEFGLSDTITNETIGRCPDVLSVKEIQEDEDLENVLFQAFDNAVSNIVETRVREGANLKHNLLEKLEIMAENIAFIEKRSPLIVEEYKERVTKRIQELLENGDDSRVAMEVTLFADKICVDEEIVRLKSHISSMKDSLSKGGAIGRKLDFIAQEMNREANTILSKSSNIDITDTGIELKTLIEMIREQIQNIE